MRRKLPKKWRTFKTVRDMVVSFGDSQLLKLFDQAVEREKKHGEVHKVVRMSKFLSLPRVETERQLAAETCVWQHRRGLYSVNPARNKLGFYARFWPYVRGYKNRLSVSSDRQVLGLYPTRAEAEVRCSEHLERNGKKPLQKCAWILHVMKHSKKGWSYEH